MKELLNTFALLSWARLNDVLEIVAQHREVFRCAPETKLSDFAESFRNCLTETTTMCKSETLSVT